MNLSWWELKNWFSDVDYTIVGSGIVGLRAGLQLRSLFPESKILILERGILPQGASTKNAGFACFGSLSEIIDDLSNSSEIEVLKIIEQRWAGLQIIRKSLGDNVLDLKQFGGYEIFLEDQEALFSDCLSKISYVNEMLFPIFKSEVFSIHENRFGFGKINPHLIYNPFEAQIDTGNMMQALLKKAISNDILILNQQTVTNYHETSEGVEVVLNDFSFKTKKLLFATNGFAKQLIDQDVKPARAQVLITEPIPGLDIKGTFHLDQGYYYFRNIGERILFGGGRNLNFEGETTTEFAQTTQIQNRLEQLLTEVILPQKEFKIEQRWSGIMGMGETKSPIVKQLSEHVYCGVRLGGMGVAIGSLIGKELADLTKK